MADVPSQKSCVGYLCGYNETLVECGYCRGSVSDPVMLQYLHNCCRSCIEGSSVGTDTFKEFSSVKCPVCGDTTEHSVLMSNGFLYNYKRLSALCSEVMSCMTCDAEDVAAMYWCADCCLCLCESDYVWHNRFHQRHRSAELEAVRTWPVSQLTPAVQCSKHKRPIDVYCFTCGTPKCLRCCYESCWVGKHYLQPHAHEETRKQLYALIANIRESKERLSRAVSGLRQKCQDTRRRLHGLRMKEGCGMLLKHRRSLKDATVNAFDTTVGVVCTNLERIWCVCTTVMGRRSTFSDTVILARNNIEMLSVDGLDWLKLLREIFMLKKIVNRSKCEVVESLRRRRKYWQENGSFSIDGSLSLTSDIMLRSCLGATHHKRAAQRAPLQFSQASVSFRTTVACYELALTRDGHVLLAANEHGLLVYSDRGQQLSTWRPERRSSGEDDQVGSVDAVSDGRAAVGVIYAQLVVLLKLSQAGDTWLQDRRVAVLQSPPRSLAIHDDLLAAAEYRYDEQQQSWVPGPVLKLLRLSSGQLLYTDKRDYDIRSVALTALCVVTTYIDRAKSSRRATPYVLDAFTHSGEFLWRHETSDEEFMWGLCVSADSWSRLYVAVSREGSFRLMAFGGADGRGIREVMSSRTHGLLYPAFLSLARGQQRTILAVLSWDDVAKQARIVSLYEAKIE